MECIACVDFFFFVLQFNSLCITIQLTLLPIIFANSVQISTQLKVRLLNFAQPRF